MARPTIAGTTVSVVNIHAVAAVADPF